MPQVAFAIRPAEPTDVPEIVAMVGELADYEHARHEAKATEADFHAALFAAQPALFALIAEDDAQQVAGFALYFLNFSTWLGKHGIYLEDLFVRPQYRGAGIGQALLGRLAQLCVERGYGRLEWWVLDWNEPALGFYRHLGAKAMDEWTVHRITGSELVALANRAPEYGEG